MLLNIKKKNFTYKNVCAAMPFICFALGMLLFILSSNYWWNNTSLVPHR